MDESMFQIMNREGRRLNATLRLPTGEARGTFIALPGLGGWKDQGIMRAISDAIARAGYLTFTFDAADAPHGPDADPMKSTTTGYVRDLEDVVTYVRNSEWFAPPLSLAGHSLGALVAGAYAAKHPDDVAQLVQVAPALTWLTQRRLFLLVAGKWIITGSHAMLGPDPRGHRLGRPWILDFMRYNGYTIAPKITAPTLVIMGSRDGLVGTIDSHRIYTAMLQNGTFALVSEANHDFTGSLPRLADTITEWLTSS